ncbi:23S rRNA (adenine(2030)-N(6))-methyltransferase RlmJ [Marinobacterium arenosum]|uniref:23S rRNA (adenine(2030)-N(6))-methyltransferase RlmJ n=1 Tax=Marinobacterium arenosum TaxID=2862496 RepID=UPI001C988068|nr:23S rRNA (adenine(2030)-N(6))-methyltransferase RlmJ [Marinobacterium arenosum]MBY4679042.1 23S rRNA (adenine(2030)-N(6))-methyltransferase RlmJ [Marinobacterium arenosum]
MREYRHGKHAGNPADFHKHLILSHLLETLQPQRYLETHAGSGMYRLEGAGEWHQGVNLIWKLSGFPLAELYFQALQALNPDHLEKYPGSPWLAARVLGESALTLFELEDAAADQLRTRLAQADVRTGDGFSGVAPLMGPDCLLLIDPPYKDPEDFERVLNLLDWLEIVPDPQVMLWYPVFTDGREAGFREQLKQRLGDNGWRSELYFAEPCGQLAGSGVAVLGDEPMTRLEQSEFCELADRMGSTVRFF